ncbi:MAG: GNAT family N-acetyltransferase [Sphingobacteriia bacterium]|nr:GNAT family N-acetyltransferase [Sphingobacteriia bacterium]
MEIQTDRTLIRPFKKQDLLSLHILHSDPELMQHMPFGQRKNVEKTKQDIENYISFYDKYGFSKMAIIDLSTNDLIGRAGYSYLPESNELELGYLLAKEYQGKGMATEVGKALINYAFNNLKLNRLVAFTSLENFASQRVLEKCGMKFYKIEEIFGMIAKFYEIKNEI